MDAKDMKKAILSQIDPDKLSQMTPEELIATFDGAAKDLRSMGGDTDEIEAMFEPYPFDQMIEDLQESPDNLKLPIIIQNHDMKNEPLEAPGGAITTFVAPSGHGKTTLALNLALHCATEGLRAHYLTYEEAAHRLGVKALTALHGKHLSRNSVKSAMSYLRGDEEYILPEAVDDFLASVEKMKQITNEGKFIIHKESPTMEKLLRFVSSAKGKLDVIFIDYIQLVGGLEMRTRQEELKTLMLGLNEAAKSTGIPIIMCAQFNREVPSPLHMDMRKIGEGSDIEKASSLVCGVWNTNKKIAKGTLSKADAKEVDRILEIRDHLYIEVLKSREVAGGDAFLPFDGNQRRVHFHMRSQEEYMNYSAAKGADVMKDAFDKKKKTALRDR